ISFFLLSLFGRYLGREGAGIISVGSLFLSCLLSFFIFYEVILMDSVCYIYLKPWVESLNVDISFVFFFVLLSLFFFFLFFRVYSFPGFGCFIFSAFVFPGIYVVRSPYSAVFIIFVFIYFFYVVTCYK